MKIISLFSGAGGLDLGLILAGNTVIWANDIDKDAVETYKENIGEHIICEDIKNINIESLPDADVVVGGFPCQGFSIANMRRMIEDERNLLYRFFYNTIKIKQPKFFIAENVKGILSLGKGEVIKQIVSDFENAGFSTQVHLVNMADYGVPQTRQRVFIIGQNNKLGKKWLFNFPQKTNSKDGFLPPWITIEQAIGHFPDPDTENNVLNHVYSAYKVEYRNFTGHRKTDPDKPSPTILARGNGKGGVCAIPHYNGKRRLTIRESASIQTFPEEFHFVGAKNSCYRQIGNAVPVLFAKKLGQELIRIEENDFKVKKGLRVVSLFSGAGGLDLGFKMAGHNIVWANDLYEDAVETYRKNLGSHIVCKDISLIPTEEIPDCDIVIGGFPCQGFSVANTKRNIKDERNVLYKQLIRVISAKKPKFFLAENVKGITNLAKGKVFEMILNDFTSIGYKVQYKILNSADYGVPQQRLRVIIIGIRNDIGFDYQYPEPTHNKEQTLWLSKWVSVAEALASIPDPDSPNNLSNHQYSKYKLEFNGYLGHRQLDPTKPAPTVTARGDNKGGVVILPHPNGKRRMSARELATIQSFPLDYVFCGPLSSVYRQIGNAVPPLLAYAVAKMFNSYNK